VAPAPATLDYGNRTVVNFQRVPGYPFDINTGTRMAVYHISDTPTEDSPVDRTHASPGHSINGPLSCSITIIMNKNSS